MRTLVAAVTLAVAGLGLAACSGYSDEAGFGLGTVTADEAAAAFASAQTEPREFAGSVFVEENGCFAWSGAEAQGAWIVWPTDAKLDPDDGGQVRLPSGAAVVGSPLAFTGALVSLADLPDGANPDSYLGAFGGFCDAEANGVMLLTAVRVAD